MLLSSLTSSLSREERVERNRDDMLLSLVVSRKAEYSGGDEYVRGVAIFVFVTKQSFPL